MSDDPDEATIAIAAAHHAIESAVAAGLISAALAPFLLAFLIFGLAAAPPAPGPTPTRRQ